MRSEKKEKRQQVIFSAAYELLARKGYKGTSMLAVAKAAGASNETMYNWFGNKQGLLAAMIEGNASGASSILSEASSKETMNANDINETLVNFGDVLLQMLTGERAVALSRAAAADVSDGNVLGPLLAENGREKLVPQLVRFFENAIDKGNYKLHDSREMTEIYLALLLADVQIRRVIGVTGAPDPGATKIHSQRVSELFGQLFHKK
jgi:AcrR family transcriptional regulator